MRRAAQRLGLALSLFALTVGAMPALAQDPPATSVATPSAFPPDEVCTAEELDKDNLESVLTPGQNAIIHPVANPDQDLYVLQTWMPSGACLGFGGHSVHNGAMMWFVTDGVVELWIEPVDGLPEASLQIGVPTESDDWQDAITQEVGSLSATLGTGSWASTDSAVHYSFRNSANTPAVVMMVVLETPRDPSVATGGMMFLANCKGNCRNPKR